MQNPNETAELEARIAHLQIRASTAATAWLRANRHSPLNLRGRRHLCSMLHNLKLIAAAKKARTRLRLIANAMAAARSAE